MPAAATYTTPLTKVGDGTEAAPLREEGEDSSSEEGEEEDADDLFAASGGRGREKARRRGRLQGGDVFVERRFGIPLWRVGLGLLVELLLCLYLSHASTLASMGKLPNAGAARWIAGFAWVCLLLSLLLRAGLITLWRRQVLRDGLLAALYMLSSSLQFLVYVSLQYAMYGAASQVSVEPEAFLNRVDGNCTRAYAPPPACDGAAEAYRSPDACCLVYRHVLHPPDRELVRPLGDFLAWAAVVAITFAWKDVPFVPVAPADTAFMSTLGLDMLDVMVFSGFLEDKHVTYPALGIDLHTARSQRKDHKLLGLMWFLWSSAFVTALLSRGIYAALRFSFSAKAKAEAEHRGPAELTAELLRSVRLLDETRARMLVGEAIRLQSEHYRDADSEEDGTPVLVDAPAPSSLWGQVHSDPLAPPGGRRAWAEMARPGEYLVEFVDGRKPSRATLPVERLEPHFAERLHGLGPDACRGWCEPRHLVRGGLLERFDRLARVLDSLRALLCLELPFLCLRWALEVRAEGRFSVWLLKNLVCTAVDVAIVAACGNEGAKCLATRPLRWLSELTTGAPARQWAEGLHRVAGDPAARASSSRYRQDIERLSQHKAWLTLECEKAEDEAAAMLGSEEAVLVARAPYEAELRRLDLELSRVACQLQVSGP